MSDNGETAMNAKLIIRGVVVLLVAGFSLFSAEASLAQSKDAGSRVYELRTYTTLPGRLPALNKRFTDHTMRIFAKHGMKNETYWIPTDAARKDDTLIYVLSHDSQEAADKSWKEFAADPEWIKVRDASEADGKILAKAPERIFMTKTDYSPGK
jgi:NIPSNAP